MFQPRGVGVTNPGRSLARNSSFSVWAVSGRGRLEEVAEVSGTMASGPPVSGFANLQFFSGWMVLWLCGALLGSLSWGILSGFRSSEEV